MSLASRSSRAVGEPSGNRLVSWGIHATSLDEAARVVPSLRGAGSSSPPSTFVGATDVPGGVPNRLRGLALADAGAARQVAARPPAPGEFPMNLVGNQT